MYSFNSRVRYSEVAADGKLSITGIVNYMQDCSGFHYDDLGKNVEYLFEVGQVWVLNSWQIVINRRPKEAENIKITTWAYDYDAMFGYRNFTIEDESGKKCAYANSVWVATDVKTGKPARIKQEVMCEYGEPKLEMDYAPRKITVPDGFIPKESFAVKYQDLDSHFHVNNGKYIEMALNYLPENFDVKQVRVQYIKSAVDKDIVTPHIILTEGAFYVSLNGDNNKPYAVIEFS